MIMANGNRLGRMILNAGMALVLAASVGCGILTDLRLPPDTVEQVDLERYLGKWYEIASFPASFQKDCYCTTATYTDLGREAVGVVNACRKGSPTGPMDVARATAYPVPDTGNAQLKVEFFWPFKGDYWIVALDPDYRYAMVGHPNKKYLWILSRTPTMDEETYEHLLGVARAKGYEVENLRRTFQACKE
jgi:apolipoprotein D and lipocalin family protein